MSHYMYKKKIFAKTSDGYIVPIVCYADSSLTTYGVDRRGRRYEYCPTYWAIMESGTDDLFVKRDVWEKTAKEAYDDQVAKLTEYYKEFHPGTSVSPESENYYGTSYLGGKKLKNMRSFFSVRRAMPFEEFHRKYPDAVVSLTVVLPPNEGKRQTVDVDIPLAEETDVAGAVATYRQLRANYPDLRYISVGIRGVWTAF